MDSDSDSIDVSATSTPALFALYRAILAQLRSRGVVRTENAPAGDYAEYLVAAAFDGELAPNSEKSWDVRLPTGKQLQVKARVVSNQPRRSQRQLSPFRSFEFDAAVIVFLAEADYAVSRAVEVPRAVVESSAKYNPHVNGHILHATDAILDRALSIDVTGLLRGLNAS
jgi:uncharacterized protein DUF6998